MDNYYNSCPPRMSDGNFLTNYKTSSNYNEFIKFNNNIVRDDDYRLFLQTNAEKMMDADWISLKKNSSCWKNACVHNYNTRMDPRFFAKERESFNSVMNNSNLTNDLQCKKYADYRISDTPLQKFQQ